MSPQRTTIILDPGSYHRPINYTLLKTELQSAGYRVIGVSLPSITQGPKQPNFNADVQAIRVGIQNALKGGQDVLVLMHSWGGMPGTEAVSGFTREVRKAKGKENAVTRLVYLAAIVVDEGEGVEDFRPTPALKNNERDTMTLDPELVRDMFYNDMPWEEADRLSQDVTPQSRGAFTSRLTYAAWRYVPSTYLVTTLDKAIQPNIQERAIKRLSKLGGQWTTEKVEAGHMASTSKPGEVAMLIRKAAGESI